MDRRSFVAGLAALGGSALAGRAGAAPRRSRVALVRARDRAGGIREALALLQPPSWQGRRLFVKPNFNSADPFPGSTHPETLRALCRALLEGGAAGLALGDRSGMGDTRAIMKQKGILDLARELGAEPHVFDELPAEGWVRQTVPGMHWSRGFALARPALDADGIVQTCCLKTHRFGGHFTLSLKNSIGLVAKRIPGDDHDYMRELHGSPDQRRMIAEVNAAYRPLFVVMDALEAFVDGGPDAGRKVAPGLILASVDRVALDAVGVAILRRHGTTPEVSRGPIFALEQLARAAELGLGARTAEEVEIVTSSASARDEVRRLSEALAA
ncbi:MAG TPA: DUF362 domain-containing protein [Anaeromyxobacteraceae bacterium]